jgi:hypothetical protein
VERRNQKPECKETSKVVREKSVGPIVNLQEELPLLGKTTLVFAVASGALVLERVA